MYYITLHRWYLPINTCIYIYSIQYICMCQSQNRMDYFPIKQGDGHTLIPPFYVGSVVCPLEGIPKDGRLHDQEMLLGGYPQNIFMMSYQPESVGNCGTSPAKICEKNHRNDDDWLGDEIQIWWGNLSWLGWLKSRTQHVGTRDLTSTKQWNFMEFSNSWVFQSWDPWLLWVFWLCCFFILLHLSGLEDLMASSVFCRASSKVWGRGPLWNQPKVAGDDADVVQQMVAATSVPNSGWFPVPTWRWSIRIQTRGMVKHGKPSILKCPYLMGTLIWEQLNISKYGFPMSMMCQAHHLMVSPIFSSPTPGQSGEPHEPHHAAVRLPGFELLTPRNDALKCIGLSLISLISLI